MDIDIDKELYKLYKKTGIKSKMVYVEELREYHIEFTKDNRHYKRIIPIDSIFPSIPFPQTYVHNLIEEAENVLNH